MPTLHTVLSPALLDLYNLENCVVVIIDVFRATSTIASALHKGAAKVIPVNDVQECIRIGNDLKAVTAGERDGKVIEGLTNGNSPTEYTQEFIKGKTLVLTTTNGTKMLHMSVERGADVIITGSFPNLSSVCDYIVKAEKDVVLACSGWKDKFNIEDTLFAGAAISRTFQHFTIHCDSSLMAQELYQTHKDDLLDFVKKTTHWHRLSKYGLEDDMQYCITIDNANVLPIFNKEEKYLSVYQP